jgi:CRISPR-associated protein Csy3
MATSKKQADTSPSVLAFERKLDPSDALMHAGAWNAQADEAAWQPIGLHVKAVRGTISNRLKGGSGDAKIDNDIQKPNLQTVDVGSLPPGCDTLRVAFTLRVLGGAGTPSACNNAAYQAKLQEKVSAYTQTHGFGPLAARYAHNLANGRFLWRNRTGAEAVRVEVSHWVNGQAHSTWQFNALSLGLRDFQATPEAQADLQALAATLASGLAGTTHVLLRVRAWVRMGEGQEVFPSQELILDKGADKKSRHLYHVNNVAALHSQKVGNAIRAIDDWHSEAAVVGPIAVEPYGSVTTLGEAFRRPKDGQDFYSLLDAWVLKNAELTAEQQHYVMAVLLRGGVFGEAEKKDKEAA